MKQGLEKSKGMCYPRLGISAAFMQTPAWTLVMLTAAAVMAFWLQSDRKFTEPEARDA